MTKIYTLLLLCLFALTLPVTAREAVVRNDALRNTVLYVRDTKPAPVAGTSTRKAS